MAKKKQIERIDDLNLIRPDEIKEYLDEGTYTELRQEGLMCEFREIDAWANKAKAQCFNLVKGTKPVKKSTGGIWGFSAPIESISKKKSSIWDD